MIESRHFCTVISPKDRFEFIFETVSPLHVLYICIYIIYVYIYFVYQRVEMVYSLNCKMLSSGHISSPPFLNNHINGIFINSV